MKIESGRGVAPAGGTRRSGAGSGAAFAPATEEPQRAAAATASSAVPGLDMILALQAEEGPAERRARQARRGRAALDVLDRLAQALLDGRAPAHLAGELQRLRAGGEMTGEEGLDAVLLEIDIRLAVEQAKLEKIQAGL